ncbi:MAG: DUF3419 family protein [Nanoarchaeota archaeon]
MKTDNKTTMRMRWAQPEATLEEKIPVLFRQGTYMSPHGTFSRFSPIYAFTTENLCGYLPCLPIPDARVLTISGSADHIINAAMLGANEIVAFDVNALSGMYSELKLAAMRNLDFDVFKDFLMRDLDDRMANQRALDHDVYASFRNDLSGPTMQFFDVSYSRFHDDGLALMESELFCNNSYDSRRGKTTRNPYLRSERAFQDAKESLDRVRVDWLEANAQDVARCVDGTFDVILLSNIADYANRLFPERHDYLRAFNEHVVAPLSRTLKPDGVLCAAYIYDANPNRRQHRSQIDDHDLRRSVLGTSPLAYREHHFESVIFGRHDAVVLLENRRERT